MIGQQKRRISCWWGNVKCKGYENKDDEKDYCDQHDVKDLFCDRFQNQPILKDSMDWEEVEKSANGKMGKLVDKTGQPRRFK